MPTCSETDPSPETVFRLTQESQPGPTAGVRSWWVISGQDASDNVLIHGNAESQGKLLSDSRTTPGGIMLFHVDNGVDEFPGRPFGPGLRRRFCENNMQYFRLLSARWRFNRVEGFRTIADRIRRAGRMKRAHNPATKRSNARSFGARSWVRIRIGSCCLTRTDSATTERTPPGPTSRARVATTWTKRMRRSRIAA